MTLRELWQRLAYPFIRSRLQRELSEELRLHLELRAEQMRDAGAAADEASFTARRRFGNVARITDASRAAWGWQWLDGAGQDLRFVLRQLRRSPGFTLVSVLTMALGIGINTTAFTFYDAIVLKPLAVPAPANVVRVVSDLVAVTGNELPFAAYAVVRRDARTLDSVVATSGPQSLAAVLPGHVATDARVMSARLVSRDYFALLGVHPAFGRAFDATDDHALVLGYDFWSRTLGADPSVIGRVVSIGGVSLTIIGIAPRSFAGTGAPALAPDAWIPLEVQPALLPGADWRHDAARHWEILARLAPARTLPQATAELAALARAVPDTLGKPTPLLAKHATFFQTDSGEFEVFQQVSVAFLAALVLILGIGTVNLVNLMAARNAAREREVTVRLALGASRGRVARQLASESLVIGFAGSAVGLAASWWFAAWLREWLIRTLTTVTGGLSGVFFDLALDWRVVLYAAGLGCFVGLCVGIAPALRTARSDVNSILKQGTTSTTGRRAWSRRNLLLATQVAGSIILLAAAGWLLSGSRSAGTVRTGFDAEHVIVVSIEPSAASSSERPQLLREIDRRIALLPGVGAVTWCARVPFGGTYLRTGPGRDGRLATISLNRNSSTYFDAMGITVVSGRTFTQAEVESNAPVAVVSEALARLTWPGQNPIGKGISRQSLLAGPDSTQTYTVVGVTKDVRSTFLSRVDAPAEYFPESIDRNHGLFLVRARGEAAATVRSIGVALSSISPSLPAQSRVVTLREGPMALQRLMAQAPAAVSLTLALIGLALAGIGVYGLISQIVVRRTREIGVHLAIGARPSQVVALVVRKTLAPVVWGAAIGLLGAVGLSAILRAMVVAPDMPDLTFGAGPFNPLVFGGVIGAVLIVALAACYLPARRAAGVDPTVAMRAE
jgi:predicted permease